MTARPYAYHVYIYSVVGALSGSLFPLADCYDTASKPNHLWASSNRRFVSAALLLSGG